VIKNAERAFKTVQTQEEAID